MGESEEMKPEKVESKSRVWRILRWPVYVVIGLLVLVAVAITVVVAYLNPERLTPLVNRYATEMLDAKVEAQRVELTFWSSFPKLLLRVDSLQIVSHSLHSLPKAQLDSLPADADSLLSLERFSGGVNLMHLLGKRFTLYDVELTNPRVNLLQVNDSVANFNIVPPSEKTDTVTAAFEMPNVSINRFAILGKMPVRYRNMADSMDMQLTLSRTELLDKGTPTYRIDIAGATPQGLMALPLPKIVFGLDGSIDWTSSKPMEVGLRDFQLSAAGIRAIVDGKVDMTDDMIVNSLSVKLPQLDIDSILPLVPQEFKGIADKVDADMQLQAGVKLLKPFRPSVDKIPDASVDVQLRCSRLKYDRLNLHRLNADVRANIVGGDLDKSVVYLDNLDVEGKALAFKIEAMVSNPLTDALVDGSFEGNFDFGRLPESLKQKLGVDVRGVLSGESKFRLRQSQLTPKRLHKIKLDGRLQLKDFYAQMRDSSMMAYLHQATFQLGSNSKVKHNGMTVDSMLTASLMVDTVHVAIPGVKLSGRDLMASVGSRNVAASADTSKINPMGLNVSAGLITMNADTANTRIRLREAKVGGVLRRYEGNAKAPELDLKVDARRISYRTDQLSASINQGHADLNLHPRSRGKLGANMQRLVDSLAMVHPQLSTDSLTSIARKIRATQRRGPDEAASGRSNLDFGIDNSLAAWLRAWQASGNVTLKRARVFTPAYPVRSTLNDFDMDFSTDSVLINSGMVQSGSSDFQVKGAVRNISRALTSRRHQPIEVDLTLRSDTLDVNEITAALLKGAAATNRISQQQLDDITNDLDSDTPEAKAVEDGAVAALLVPSNVNANLRFSSKHIHYADMWLSNFGGRVEVYDGAVSLNRLRASTPMGSVNLSALYSAPTADKINVAASVDIKKLHLHEILQQMPQIDSLMPMLREVDGIVDAKMGLTAELDSLMNLKFNTVDMAIQLAGDSLVLLDSETFRTVAKWMLFKNKKRNMIDHMDVEITMHNGWLDLYPVIFDMDRYRLGVMGNNDLNFNLDYHVAVLKSPIPFKFGINIKGTPEKMKIRLGKARINEKTVASSRRVTDSLQVNLRQEMQTIFRRGIRRAGNAGLRLQSTGARKGSTSPDASSDTISAADSAEFIRQGLIAAPPVPVVNDNKANRKSKKK